MVNTVERRDYIHNYLYRINDKSIDDMLKQVKTLVEKDIALTLDQEEEVAKRVMRHKNGNYKSYSWSEVKNRQNQVHELYLKEADGDVFNARNWYESRSIGLGDEFLDEIEEYVKILEQDPQIYQLRNHNWRYCPLKRYCI